MQSGVGAVEVIVVKIVGKESSTVVTGVVGAGIGPFAGDVWMKRSALPLVCGR